jgi:hypothetical protein
MLYSLATYPIAVLYAVVTVSTFGVTPLRD